MSLVYTSNDEKGNPQIFCVEVETGKTVGTFNLSPALPSGADPEAIRLDAKTGILYLADIGDNDGDRTNIALYGLKEPGPGNHGTLVCKKYPISYPFGPTNAESLAINPVTGLKYIITKETSGSRLCRLAPTISGAVSTLRILETNRITDADFTTNGQWLFVISEGTQAITVYNALNWQKDGTIPVPNRPAGKCESISCELNGKSVLLGFEGVNSPLYRVVIPTRYRGNATSTKPPGGGGGDCNAQLTDPGDVLNLKNWKLTLPINTGHAGDPDEIKQPELDTFENSYFYDMCPEAVVFRAPANGATTGGSPNPRCELREMKPGTGGQQEASWSTGSGKHVMDIVQAITHLPSRDDNKNPVVAGQVHGGGDDFSVLRCESRNVFVKRDGKNVLLCNLWITNDDDTNYKLITNSYELGRYFRIRLTASGGGVSFAYDDFKGAGLRNVGRVNGNASGCYFKAGCYTQANPSNGGKGYGEVRIKSLTVTHS